MAAVRLTIVYYSTYGTNHQMAEIAAGAARAAGAEVRLRRAPETVPEGVVNGQDAWRAQAERSAHIPQTAWNDAAGRKTRRAGAKAPALLCCGRAACPSSNGQPPVGCVTAA